MATQAVAAVETQTQQSEAISAEQSSTERNAVFVQQLRDELTANDDGAGDDDDDDSQGSSAAQAAKPAKPEKRPVAATEAQVSSARVLELLRAGDMSALAKELGQDPREFRVKNSQFIRLRQQEKQTREKLAQARHELEQERNNLRQRSDTLTQTQAKIFEAVKHIENEDWIAFLETATGRPFDEIQKQLVQNSLDPSAKEIRRLKAEREREQREREQEKQQLAEQQRAQQQAQAKAQYLGQLKAELLEDEDFGLDEFAEHPNMPRFLEAVFTEQQKAFDGEQTISARKAAERAIKILVREAESWSPFVSKYNGSAGTAPKEKTGEQSARGASKPARTKSVARGQGGAPADVRKMSHQELISHFADQMRTEFR